MIQNCSEIIMASFANDTATVFENGTEFEYTVCGADRHAEDDVDVLPPTHRYVVAVCFSLFTFLGLFGNSLVIVSVIISRKLRTTTNILVVNLAVADFLTCAFFPFQVVGLVNHSGDYPLPEIICQIVGGVHYICPVVSIMTLSAIAVVRWYVITKSIRGHRGLHTPWRVVSLVVIIWTVSIVVLAVNHVLKIGEVGYSPIFMVCFVLETNPCVGFLLQGGIIFANLVIIGMFYALILRHVLRQGRQFRINFGDSFVSIHNNSGPTNPGQENALLSRREIEITKNLFLVVCVFVLCCTPYCFHVLIWSVRVFGLYSGVILTANSTVNPIIYGLRHPNFREVFRSILMSSINRVTTSTHNTSVKSDRSFHLKALRRR